MIYDYGTMCQAAEESEGWIQSAVSQIAQLLIIAFQY